MKIVVVEDEISSRNGLINTLPRLDESYEVVGAAADGKEGMEVISRTRPDLIIMDIRMPEMDGLTMLEQLRRKQMQCKVLVLTAYSDFDYAKKAIELGIENYLLKPIKIPELKRSLERIQEEWLREKDQVLLQERLFSLEQIIRGCMLAELQLDEGLNQITREKYGLDMREPLVLFNVWLGNDYAQWATKVQKLMEECSRRAEDYRSIVLVSTRYEFVQMVLYQIRELDPIRHRYETALIPVICRDLKKIPIFTWVQCDGLEALPEGLAEMQRLRRWNLSFPEGTLLNQKLLSETTLLPLKYPVTIETELSQALLKRKPDLFAQIGRRFVRYCRDDVHDPEEIRSVCMRLGIYLAGFLKNMGIVGDIEFSRELVESMTNVMDWAEMDAIFKKCADAVEQESEEDRAVSPLIRQARRLIDEYYSQGITLEEIASRLHVSAEYLSVCFRRETGASFTETVRSVRIKRIKELLLHSNLKLNQIADMVGYSDAKYMSRVFREETGMLPADFRKLNG